MKDVVGFRKLGYSETLAVRGPFLGYVNITFDVVPFRY